VASQRTDWVVRGGIAAPDVLIAGYREHVAVPGLYGFSVQRRPGHTVEELATAGQMKNAQISYATASELRAALQLLGYRVRLVRSPGRGFHHTFVVLVDANGTLLQQLPRDAAEALSDTFRRRPNPHQTP
jgi:hypothetical protein